MQQEQHILLRTWLIRWMYAAAMVHFVIGALLPWLANTGLVEVYHQHIERHFWPQAAPDAARTMQVWWMSLFGATVQTVGLWMGALVYLGNRHRSRFAWLWLMIGILIWAPQDMLISMQADMLVNVWVDAFAVLSMIPPLFILWKMDAPVSGRNL
ncbi:cell division protein [Undibacterium sp. Ji49W]|uniref:cell division protein n=1 Tax=Undibacterium sp. Ji49W TaxID=3413040 RepID=UPI003BF03124